jgi:hypothetical protein
MTGGSGGIGSGGISARGMVAPGIIARILTVASLAGSVAAPVPPTGCDGERSTAEPRGVQSPRGSGPKRIPEGAHAPDPRASGQPTLDPAAAAARRETAETVEPGEPPAVAEPPPNLGPALRRAIGDPTSCLNAVADVNTLPAELELRVTAHLSTTGRVTRATVDAPGVPPDVRRCVEDRASRSRLHNPEGASKAETTLTIRRRPG